MIIAAAQTSPKRGDISANLNDHYHWVTLAAQHGVELIVFPEMSITGYEHEQAMDMAFTSNDARLERLRQLAVDKNMTVVVGAPVLLNHALYIGSLVLMPNNTVAVYTKQFLHPGEEQFFKATFENNPQLKLHNEKISLAICADIDTPQHAVNAQKCGATMYLASIFFSPGGIAGAHKTLSGFAQQHCMLVLMANFCGQSWGMPAAGQSAFWNKQGELVASLDNTTAGLLVLEGHGDSWNAKVVK